MTTEELQKLLSEATPGPWGVCGDEPWNLTVNYEPQGRVCFLAHSNGLNDDRDFANARLIALAPTLAAENLAMRADIARLTASLAAEVTWSEKMMEAADRMVEALRAADSYLARGHDKMAYNITRAALAAWEAAQ